MFDRGEFQVREAHLFDRSSNVVLFCCVICFLGFFHVELPTNHVFSGENSTSFQGLVDRAEDRRDLSLQPLTVPGVYNNVRFVLNVFYVVSVVR